MRFTDFARRRAFCLACGLSLGIVLLLGSLGVASGQGLPTSTPLPSLTPTAPASPAVNITPTRALIAPGSPPPITITLPQDWRGAYQTVPIRVALEEYAMNVAIYRGALQNGGTGTIVILWGFPSIAPPPTIPPAEGTPTAAPDAMGDFVSQMLWSDGLRLLQGTLVDITCNVGTSGQQRFSVGKLPAIGTFFNIAQCQGEPDTAGWLAGVRVEERNYLFYSFIDPVEAYNGSRAQLQDILDTVQFITATATPKP